METAIIIPNWNGADDLPAAIDSVLGQSYQDFTLLIVDNGSTDGSRKIIKDYLKKSQKIKVIWREKNYGYTGGVNPGFEFAIDHNFTFAAPFNNDAVADKNWLAGLVKFLKENPKYGIAACNLLHADGRTFDSTGDIYTNWGLPFPRGRDEKVSKKYYKKTDVFGASGGASLYRVDMLKEIGLLDEDFFAYYEDIDLSFRAQLAGWRVAFVPSSVVYHMEGVTRRKMISSFAATQTIKNLPLVLFKNVPARYLFTIGWRYLLAHTLFFGRAVLRGYGWAAIKADFRATVLIFKKIPVRHRIQKTKKVSSQYIWGIIDHDLPQNATNLRKLRGAWWKLTGRK